ncbi:MAG: TIGR03087 family PEP-CTERM/XrtA system glycosyltransferase [Betaproteobacteria bacterium]
MESLLFLVHRIPFPPNKGDKVRSFHLLEFLASRYRVHLGTFVDTVDDVVHIPRLQEYCASFKVAEIRPALARMRSLSGLLTDEALTLRYYRNAMLADWVQTIVRDQHITRAVVFSSAMVPYVLNLANLRVVVDFVDVDSAKWAQYAQSRSWPLSMIYRREGARLLAFERAVANRTEASVFVTPAEAQLFRTLAPESAQRIRYAQNGVDTEYFSPDHALPNPFPADEDAIVFTGAMDYWPNIDAVIWFAQEALPKIVAQRPNARFYIVGIQPSSGVQALAKDPRIVVTGRVPDVRPYLKHARVVVAPLRVARGIQNKVLEAMAMARPVVVSAAAAGALSGVPTIDFDVASDIPEFISKTLGLMNRERGNTMGRTARQRVLADYDWTANLTPFATILDGRADAPAAEGANAARHGAAEEVRDAG